MDGDDNKQNFQFRIRLRFHRRGDVCGGDGNSVFRRGRDLRVHDRDDGRNVLCVLRKIHLFRGDVRIFRKLLRHRGDDVRGHGRHREDVLRALQVLLPNQRLHKQFQNQICLFQ